MAASGVARQDIRQSARFIADDNPEAARRWTSSILTRIQLLADTPRMGAARDDIRPGLRTFVHGSHLIFYRITAPGIEVVRVVHGARQWQHLV